jgi:hypothetical protein
MTTVYQKYLTIDDIPNSKGKQVLLKILSSPKVDREKLRKDVLKYEKKRLKEWKEEDKK